MFSSFQRDQNKPWNQTVRKNQTIIMRTCSNGSRCLSRNFDQPLTADNFRKAPSGTRANQFFRQCNRCRKKKPCPRNNDARPHDRCTSCRLTRELQYFLDSNGISLILQELIEITRHIDGYLYLLSTASW